MWQKWAAMEENIVEMMILYMLGVSIENTKTFFLHLFTLIVSSFTSESNKQFSINSTVYRYMLQLIMSIITIDN